MISIIVCSRHKQITRELETNIKSTIGEVEYEIIWIDNSKNTYNIFQAYNEGVRKSKGEYLCFMHEDIIFHSNYWGEEVCRLLKDEDIGMLGIVGTAYLGLASISWWNNYASHGHLIQGYHDGKKYKTTLEHRDETTDNQIVAADGLWLCFRKNMFDDRSLWWDEITFKGFHFYDLDISMQVYKSGKKAITADEILVEHTSYGTVNEGYITSIIPFHKKWDYLLPAKTDTYEKPFTNIDIEDLIRQYCNQWQKRNELYSLHQKFLFRCAAKIYSFLGM